MEITSTIGPIRKLPPLYRQLLNPNGILLRCTLDSIREGDRYIPQALVHLFASQQCAIRLLKAAISLEVEATTSSGTLFRGNSSTTKMLSFFADIYGKTYLISTLRAPISLVLTLDRSLELNPSKIKSDVDIDANFKHVLDLSTTFLSSIIRSVRAVPLPFRKICRLLYTTVSQKFPESSGIAVGGFIFLRFLVPAINMYQMKGIADKPPSRNQKKTLLYISKILQNCANNVEFGGKEAFMAPANSFILANRKRMLNFFNTLASSTQNSAVSRYIVPTGIVTQSQVAKGLKDLTSHYYKRRAQCMESLNNLLENSNFDKNSVSTMIENLDRLAKQVRLPASELSNQSSDGTGSLTLLFDPSGEHA